MTPCQVIKFRQPTFNCLNLVIHKTERFLVYQYEFYSSHAPKILFINLNDLVFAKKTRITINLQQGLRDMTMDI